MSLYRRAVVFADIRNMIVSTDAVVAARLKEYFKKNKHDHYFFKDTIDELPKFSCVVLKVKLMEEKNNRNFLMDYFDWETTSHDSVNPLAICEYLYKEVLHMDFIENDPLYNLDVEGIMTNVGASLRTLLEDVNLDTLYLYMDDTIPDVIKKRLVFFFKGSPKLKFVSGDKHQFLKDHPCDSYFLEDVSDIDEHLCFPHNELCEVIVPASKNNMTIVDKEGPTCLRLASTDNNMSEYKEKYNLDICTINLPI